MVLHVILIQTGRHPPIPVNIKPPDMVYASTEPPPPPHPPPTAAFNPFFCRRMHKTFTCFSAISIRGKFPNRFSFVPLFNYTAFYAHKYPYCVFAVFDGRRRRRQCSPRAPKDSLMGCGLPWQTLYGALCAVYIHLSHCCCCSCFIFICILLSCCEESKLTIELLE